MPLNHCIDIDKLARDVPSCKTESLSLVSFCVIDSESGSSSDGYDLFSNDGKCCYS